MDTSTDSPRVSNSDRQQAVVAYIDYIGDCKEQEVGQEFQVVVRSCSISEAANVARPGR